MIVRRNKNFSSYVPYKEQEKDKKDRRKLLAGGLALTGAGSVAGYKTEVALGNKKIDKNIKSRVSDFKVRAGLRNSAEKSRAEGDAWRRGTEIKAQRNSEIGKAEKSIFFKNRKIRKANQKATELLEENARNLKARIDKANATEARNIARYENTAKKVASNSKRLLKNSASNRALGTALVGTGITLGAVKALKYKQKKNHDSKT